jgi:hypothetical protein
MDVKKMENEKRNVFHMWFVLPLGGESKSGAKNSMETMGFVPDLCRRKAAEWRK